MQIIRDNLGEGRSLELHPFPVTVPVTAEASPAICVTAADQLEALFATAKKYRAYRHWSRIRLGGSEKLITGQGFNAVKFDPGKPARTIPRNDGNLGMHGAMQRKAQQSTSIVPNPVESCQ